MNVQLKINDGSTVNLLFSMYFVNRVCKLTGKGLSDIFQHLIGEVINLESGVVHGGLLDDLEVRAAVIAAGVEADLLAKGEYKPMGVVDGFMIMENIENSLASPVWGEVFVAMCKSIIADKLPKEEAPKKKAVLKKTTVKK